MTQQPLSNFEIKELAEKIVRNNQASDIGLKFNIEAVLSNYILIPKYQNNDSPGSARN